MTTVGDECAQMPEPGITAQDVELASSCSAPVLITGGTPTARERCVRTIHEGSRAGSALVVLTCGCEPLDGRDAHRLHDESLLQRAVAHACGGTLFLDEIDCLRPALQHVLLVLTDSGPLEARLVVGCSRSLFDTVAAGSFREALFYRLNVIHVCLSDPDGS